MRFKKEKSGILEADLTPMIDMTFQLIAFFMLIINFSTDRHHEILLPDSELAKPPDSPPEYDIVLTLNEQGNVMFNESRDLFTDLDLLVPFLTREVSNAASQSIPVESIDVIIRSHKRTPTGMVQEVMAKCQEVSLQKFALRVEERK